MNIKFYWNGNFAGTNYCMIIDNKEIGLGRIWSNENDAKLEAIEILKRDYNIDYNKEDISFEWGGRL